MKMKEFDTFKAVYCGLCKQLGKVYGPFARFTLSYDFTFLALISLGMQEQCGGFKHQKCMVNPLKKKPCLMPCDDLTYSASAAMVMFYYKLKDNYEDGNFLDKCKSLLLMPFAASARKKARKLYSELDQIVGDTMKLQSEVEHSDSTKPDEAAQPTALALAKICENLSQDALDKRVLYRLGYLIGRYVYFIDALDDLEDDIRTGSYNIFYKKFTSENIYDKEQIKEYAIGVINLTIAEIASTYELCSLNRYQTILNNIIYLGLHNSLHTVVNKANASHLAASEETEAAK